MSKKIMNSRVLMSFSFAAAVGFAAITGAADAPASHEIQMKSISFEPKKLEVHLNDSVVWTNVAFTDHSATSDDKGIFDTGMIHPKNKSKPVVFSKPGTFNYHCSMHGKSMSGQIQVNP